MGNLSVLTSPVTAHMKYPDRIRNLIKIPYEERILERPYIGNQLDSDLNYSWTRQRAVVIETPTCTGKTTFALKGVVARANKKAENVLIVTNRSPLNLSYKKAAAKSVGKEDDYTDKGLQHVCEFENVFVVNYQGLESFINKHRHIKFSYVICDECHYFLQDASFSDCTGFALDSIPKEFPDAVRIYISATIENVLPYIAKAESHVTHVDDCGNCFCYENFYYECVNHRIPIVYKMDSDYSKVDLQFFDSEEYLTDYLKTQSAKVLAFCDSKKECAEFAELMGGG